MPRGADAVVMIENTLPREGAILVHKSVVPGSAVSFAGTDIAAGETVLHRGARLTSRETGVLAATGHDTVPVYRRPRVAILSTGDEIIAPGEAMSVGKIFDSNATIVADAVREIGAEPVRFGIVPDDAAQLEAALRETLACDFVLLSGGTSKGAGDLNYTVVAKLGKPGILVHGVALKPGKPLCLAKIGATPLAILPGFPTSAVFTFHMFVAPVLRLMAGLGEADPQQVAAILPMRVNSEKGRTEFLLVNLVEGAQGFAAYPMGKGSGSVTAFSKADGFIAIDRSQEIVDQGAPVRVTLIGQAVQPADLIVIGSQCVGVDLLLSHMSAAGWRVKYIAVGSLGGIAAAKRQECDIAGSHLLDEQTGVYNLAYLDASLHLEKGYGRHQGFVYRPDDARFAGKNLKEAVAAALADPQCLMINRNRGSGTRVLIDQLLKGARAGGSPEAPNAQPSGFHVEAKAHNAVASAVAQKRADWGVAIDTVAKPLGLGFIPIADEEYDFVIPKARLARPAVQAFLAVMGREEVRQGLRNLGMTVRPPASGKRVTA
jgi:putative molybdopterin biosynthesis protein